MESNQMGVIRPFNLDPGDYEAMYNGPLPDKLQAILITNVEVDVETVHESIMDLMSDDEPEDEEETDTTGNTPSNSGRVLNPRVCGLKCGINLYYFNFMSRREFSGDPSIIRPIREDSIDIQLVFQEIDFMRPLGIIDGQVYAMDLFDHLCATTRSCESKAHLPIERDPETAERFRFVVHDIYRRRWGYMNRQLVDYRNKLLVMAIAMAIGKDPILAYDRFVKANGKSYLEYGDLCW
jgi:hypothetical protein